MVPPNNVRIRLMAANLSSGNFQSYDDPVNGCAAANYAQGEGGRLIEAMKPDIVMIQEFNYYGPNCKNGGNTSADVDGFVARLSASVGFTYSYYREPFGTPVLIPNGVISRYPIV